MSTYSCPPSVCERTPEGLMVTPHDRLVLAGGCDGGCPAGSVFSFSFYREGLSGAFIPMDDFENYVTGWCCSDGGDNT